MFQLQKRKTCHAIDDFDPQESLLDLVQGRISRWQFNLVYLIIDGKVEGKLLKCGEQIDCLENTGARSKNRNSRGSHV